MAMTRVLRRLLYGVTLLDGLTIASVVALVASVALIAVGVRRGVQPVSIQ
jgi:hypothetical protein